MPNFVDASAAGAVLKDRFTSRIQNQVRRCVRLFAIVDKGTKAKFDGLTARFPFDTNLNWGAASSPNSALPQARSRESVQGSFDVVRVFGVIDLDNNALARSKSDLGAYANLASREITGMKDTIVRVLNRQMYGVGDGKLGECSGATTATTFTLRTTSGTGFTGNFGARYTRRDQWLAILAGTSGAGAARATNLRVSSVNWSTNVVTVSASQPTDLTTAGIVAGDSVYTQVQEGITSRNAEINGLGNLLDNGTWAANVHGQSRTTYPILNTPVLANGGTLRPITTALLQQGRDNISLTAGRDIGVKFYLTSHGIRQVFALLLQNQKRYTNEKDMGLGFKENLSDTGWDSSVQYNETPMVVDNDCPYYTIFGFDPKSIVKYELEALHWADEDGGVWRMVPGYDRSTAFMRAYLQLVVEHPNWNFVVRDIDQTLPDVDFS